MKTTIKLTGTPNVGRCKERTEEFTIKTFNEGTSQPGIIIKDSEGKTLISFNPFFDGGSVWLSYFSSLHLDIDTNDNPHRNNSICTWSSQVAEWKKDSEELAKIKEAYQLLKEVRG